MAKALLLVLAIASGLLVQECETGAMFADMPIEFYDLKVVNIAARPVRVRATMPDLEIGDTVGSLDSTHWGGLKMGKWTVRVSQFRRTDDLNRQYAELSERFGYLARSGSEVPNRLKEIAKIEVQLRGLLAQIEAAEQEVASCSGEFVWNKDDIHLRDTVTVSFEAGAWKVSC